MDRRAEKLAVGPLFYPRKFTTFAPVLKNFVV